MEGRSAEKYVQREVQKLFDDYYSSAGNAFAHVAVREFFDIQDEDLVLERCDIGGKNDRGIDAFWHDSIEDQVVVVQAKYSEGGLGSFDRKAVLELDGAYSWLTSLAAGKQSRARDQVIAAARTLSRVREAEPHYPVFLYCIVFGTFTDTAREECQRFNEQHRSESVELLLVDFELLAQRISERWSRDEPLKEEVRLTLLNHFEYEPPGQPKALVGTIDGAELARIERNHQYRIFQRNVRYFLKTTGVVNRSIERTLKTDDGRERFWYYNNGIVVVCDKYEFNPSSGEVVLSNMQIVNGCQTTTTLGRNVEQLEGLENRPTLLVRIIESSEDSLQSNITLYTNRQNAVKDRDLSSNDPIQDRLQVEFSKLPEPWFYERKRGEWEALVQPHATERARYGNRRIDNEKAAQAAYAFFRSPDRARADKRLLFQRNEDGGFYEDIFNDDTTALSLLFPFRVAEFIAGKKQAYLREYKQAASGDQDAKAKRILSRDWIKFADQFILGTIAFYIEQRHKLNEDTFEILLGNNFDAMVKAAYVVAVADLSIHFGAVQGDAIKRDGSFSAANYVKNSWAETLERLENEWERREGVGKDPLEGIPLLESEKS